MRACDMCARSAPTTTSFGTPSIIDKKRRTKSNYTLACDMRVFASLFLLIIFGMLMQERRLQFKSEVYDSSAAALSQQRCS